MDYTKIMNDKSGKKARVGIVGATKGYGYTLLAQIPSVKLMELRTKQTAMLPLKIRSS